MGLRFVHVCKTLTDLEILGCQLHQNAFGGRAPPGPAGGAIALSRAPSHYVGEGDGKANERFANSEGGEWGYGISEGWEGDMEGWKREWRDGKVGREKVSECRGKEGNGDGKRAGYPYPFRFSGCANAVTAI